MAVNDLTFNQLSTLLTSIVSQATGKAALTPTNTSEFVSVGTTALKTGYDPIIQSISQVLSNTIFSVRPYSRKFGGLQVSTQKYGNITRKLSPVDMDFEDDERLALEDGSSIDQYKVNKPKALQENFYGANVYQKHLTIFRDQLDSAFSGPDGFAEFLSMILSNASDQIEQAHEDTARMTLLNFMAGKKAADNGVVHLLSEYNALTGLSLTAADIYKPDNLPAFFKWAYARINSASSLLTERSQLYHINVNGKPISRHTPREKQRVYVLADNRYQMDARVLADTYHDSYLKDTKTETVNFWQAIQAPSDISVTPTYLHTDGTLKTSLEPVTSDAVFACIFDEDALGYTMVNSWSSASPFNAGGGYYNQFWHFTDRYWNSFTENGLIFLLD